MTLPKHHREQSPEDVKRINAIKDAEAKLLSLLVGGGRETALARTNIEQGVMWGIRAIAKPREIQPPEFTHVTFLPAMKDDGDTPTLTETWGFRSVRWSEFSTNCGSFDFFASSNHPDISYSVLHPDRLTLISVNGEGLPRADKYTTTSFDTQGIAWLHTDKVTLSLNIRTGALTLVHHEPDVKSFGICLNARAI